MQQFRGGEHEEWAARLAYEIEEAKMCLRDPRMRQQYFALLRKRKQTHRTVYVETAPAFVRRQAVGEEHGTTKTFAGVMAVILTCMLLAVGVSFMLPWGKPPKVADEIEIVEVVPESSSTADNQHRREENKTKSQNDWIDLLSSVNLDSQIIHGKWVLNEGRLSSLEPDDYTSIKFPFSEKENYEIEAEFAFTPDHVSYDGVMLSVPVGESRTRIEVYNDWCILREVSIALKPEGWSINGIGWWEDFQNGRKYGSYKPEERALGYGTAKDGWHFSSEIGDRVKMNINVTKHKEQHRVEVRLNGHKTHDWTTSADQFSENQEPRIWRQHSKEGFALATGWDGMEKGAQQISTVLK